MADRTPPRGALRYSTSDGAWRSLEARCLWVAEVAGSNPAAPTTCDRTRQGATAPDRFFRSLGSWVQHLSVVCAASATPVVAAQLPRRFSVCSDREPGSAA